MNEARRPREGMSRASIAVAAFSTVLEWYDFTLYLYFATVLSRVFFGAGETAVSTTLAAFAIAYLLRPLGGAVFGHIGDRFGRRRTMLLSVALMTMTMLGTALLPTHAQAGAAAGWLLFLLRCLMGFSVGGEYIAIVAYLLEGSPRARRGLITSLASAFSEVGGLLAVGVSLLTVNSLSPASLESWGWRIPFLVGAVLAASVWIARTTMEESPDFERQQASGTTPARPLLYALMNHRAGILRAFAISALGSITYYVGITYVPTFLISAGKLNEGNSLRLSTAAAFAVIVVTPFAGALSDRLGRKPVLIVLSLCSAILPITLFHLMAGGSPSYALFAAVILACVAGAVSAVGAIATAEQFPGEGRISGLALGATSATAIFGGADALCRPGPDGTHRLDHGPGRHDRRGGCPGASDLDDRPGDGAREQVLPKLNREASGHIDAAGDIDPLPGHEPRLVGAQEEDDICDILRLFEPPKRRLRHVVFHDPLRWHIAQAGLPLDLARLHAGLDEAGADRVDANALRGQLSGERLRPAEDGELRCRIMGEQRRADLGGERSGVDDAARALRDEMPGRNLVGEEYAARIDGEIEVPFLVGQFKRVLHGGDAGVGDENLAPAKLRERFAERALDRGAIAHIDLDGDRIRADLLRGSQGPLAIDIGDRDFHSASRERGAMARPMPCAPPVMKARLPRSSE